MRHIIFWQNIFSPHQAGFLTSLARRPDYRVTTLAPRAMSLQREQMGWSPPEMVGVETIIDPDPEIITRLCTTLIGERIHIYGGFNPLGFQVEPLPLLEQHGAVWGFIAERATTWKRNLLLLRLKYFLLGRRYARSSRFLLAIGQSGVDWFTEQKWPEDKVFPFAYFPMSAERSTSCDQPANGPFQILFVGSLVPLKSLETLLLALSRLTDHPWQLTVVGDGPLRSTLEKKATTIGLGNRIAWTGPLERGAVLQAMQEHDLLVLPSGYDGWGAVVSEALLQGTPALVSTACGASDLVREPWRGASFPAGDVNTLSNTLEQCVMGGRLSYERRLRIREWAHHLHTDRPAQVFANLLDHILEHGPRPSAPWAF